MMRSMGLAVLGVGIAGRALPLAGRLLQRLDVRLAGVRR